MNRTEPLAVVDRALAAIARYERPDLDDRLRHARARLRDDRVRVLVVGEFKQGKSMLVNGLVGAPVCPTFDDVATAVPTHVRHAETGDGSPWSASSIRPAPTRTSGAPSASRCRPTELADHVCEQGNPGNREGWSHVEVAVPRPVLAGGLELVDTPGVGGLQSVHGAATMAALPGADAVLLVSDAAQEYTAPELEFLAHAASVCPNVACVRHQDRPVPVLAAHRRARPRAPGRGRDHAPRCSGCPRRCAGTRCWRTTPRPTPSPASRS